VVCTGAAAGGVAGVSAVAGGVLGAAEGLAAAPGSPPADFERQVMEKIRSMRAPRSRTPVRRWAVRLSAAACLLAAFWLGTRVARRAVPAPQTGQAVSMSDSDRADDDLLRDVARLVSSEDDTNWRSLAPLPPVSEGSS